MRDRAGPVVDEMLFPSTTESPRPSRLGNGKEYLMIPMRYSPILSLVVAGAIGLVACGSSVAIDDLAPQADASVDGPKAATPLTDAGEGDAIVLPDAGGAADVFKSAGFTVSEGVLSAFDLSTCCEAGKSCYANNPASPYLVVKLPPGPGQTVANPDLSTDAAGRSAAFRLRADEAVVTFLTTPPQVGYFGLTPYLYDRQQGTTRNVVFASLSDSFNGKTAAGSASTYGRKIALVQTANAATEKKVAELLAGVGYTGDSIVKMPWVMTPTVSSAPPVYGLDPASDTFSMLMRLAPLDQAQKDAIARYIASPGATVLRLTPTAPVADTAFPQPFPARTPAVAPEDPSGALQSALDTLQAQIIAKYPGYIARQVSVNDQTPDPATCVASGDNCNGDNRDTVYPASAPFLFPDADEFLVVFGANHAATGHATYSSFGVYTVDHLLGVVSTTSQDFPGAVSYFHGNTAAPYNQLYAWIVGRSCNEVAAGKGCTVVSSATCPTGIADGAASFLTYRAYVDPRTGTRPRPQDLVPERVLRFTKRKLPI